MKPERDQNSRDSYRINWWIHGEPRKAFRPALEGLPRYVATVETSKHRFFQFLDASVLPDNRLVCFAHDDSYVLGVLSSRIHVTWALATGGTLEDRPVYNKTTCFETFPFPAATEDQKSRIREIAERLDAHRKRQLALHDSLTMTDMYNVLELLGRDGSPSRPPVQCSADERTPRGGVPTMILTPKQRAIHDQGLVTVLRQLHDELDAAVAVAYGWKWGEVGGRRTEVGGKGMTDADILDRLVALSKQRADEESHGLIRYLRPAYQQPHVVPAALPCSQILVSRTLNPDLRPPLPSLSRGRPPSPTRSPLSAA